MRTQEEINALRAKVETVVAGIPEAIRRGQRAIFRYEHLAAVCDDYAHELADTLGRRPSMPEFFSIHPDLVAVHRLLGELMLEATRCIAAVPDAKDIRNRDRLIARLALEEGWNQTDAARAIYGAPAHVDELRDGGERGTATRMDAALKEAEAAWTELQDEFVAAGPIVEEGASPMLRTMRILADWKTMHGHVLRQHVDGVDEEVASK